MIPWKYLKQVIDAKQVYPQFSEDDTNYYIKLFDGQAFIDECIINKVLEKADKEQFEASYKPLSNPKLYQNDSDGAPLARAKAAPTGWTFQLRGFEFITSALASIINLDQNGQAGSDISIKLYDGNGAEITVAGIGNVNLLTCVKTVIDFEPPYDYYIVGAKMRTLSALNADVRVTAIAVPDVPYAYGGSRVFVQNANFRYIAANDKFDADGRAAKFMPYSAVNHTNKIRLIINHAAGAQHSFSVNIEHFRF
jgi:hypothetical protein